MTKREYTTFKWLTYVEHFLFAFGEEGRFDKPAYAILFVSCFAGLLGSLGMPGVLVSTAISGILGSVLLWFGVKGLALLGLLAIKPVHSKLHRKWVRTNV
jgi:hypothetical protein